MIRGSFLSPRQRSDLKALLRDGHTEHRLARRANAMLLLDDGWNCQEVAQALYLDDDTVANSYPLGRTRCGTPNRAKCGTFRQL
jgi:hypothetical protein